MPLPALLAIAALAGAATLSDRAQAGSRARMTRAQAWAHKDRLVELLREGSWRDALELNKAKGKRKLDLTCIKLTNSDLTGANLTNGDLTGADLRYANLSDADFTNANLTNAWLIGADLTNANLTGANLERADLPEGFLAPGTRLDAVPWRGTPSGWQVVASPRGLRLFPGTGG